MSLRRIFKFQILRNIIYDFDKEPMDEQRTNSQQLTKLAKGNTG